MKQGFCISKIYDAATSESQWDETMDVITEYTGAKGGILLSMNMHLNGDRYSQKQSSIWRSAPPEFHQHVATEFLKYDQEAWQAIDKEPSLVIHHDGDGWDLDELNQRPDMQFYRENYGVGRRLAAKLCDHPGWLESVALQFDAKHQVAPDSSRQALADIVRHIAKAAELSRTLNLLEQRYDAVHAALDNIHVGVCIARANGEIILRNTEANRILDAKDPIWLSPDNRLVSKCSSQSAEIAHAVNTAINTRRGEGSQIESLIAFQSQTSARHILAEITPISDSLNEIQQQFQGALIYLIDPDNPAPLKIERLAAVSRLSTAESAISERLAHGWTNIHIAEDRNVSVDTVKTHIAHVFAKTGVKNRSELIRLILKTSPPVG